MIVHSIPILYAQPFVDIVNVSLQRLQTTYKDSSSKSITNNSYFGIMLPLKLDSTNLLIVRLNGEILSSDRGEPLASENKAYVGLFGLGWQHQLNKKLSITALSLSKISSDLKNDLSHYDLQYGGSLLFQYKPKSNMRWKLGVYYNREPFGNFFVPLLGLDWQISEKKWLYGTLPLSMRYEYKTTEKLYLGAGLKIFGRSYRLGSDQNRDYIWNQENQLKLFADYYLSKNLVLYSEVGYTIDYGPRQYADKEQREVEILSNPVYRPLQDGIYLNLGCALRVRRGI